MINQIISPPNVNLKSRYGSAIQIQQKLFTNNVGKMDYQYADYFKDATSNVNKFVNKQVGVAQNYNVFQTLLGQKINKGKQNVKNFKKQKISQYYPWIFSQDYLFQPLRSILFCLKRNIPLQGVQQVQKNVDINTVNSVCYQAIYQSIKYQSPYLQQARAFIMGESLSIDRSENKKLFKKLAIGRISSLNAFIQRMNSLGLFQWGTKLKSFFLKTKTQIKQSSDFQLMQMQKGVQQFRGNINQLMNTIFKQLRVYGQIIINFSYLKALGTKNLINGVLLYSLPTDPNLMIGVQQSIPTVYINQNGILKQISQNKFTWQLLRQYLQIRLLKVGGTLYKTLTQQYQGDFQLNKQKQSFSNSYLKFNNRRRPLDAQQQKKARQFIKNKDMKGLKAFKKTIT